MEIVLNFLLNYITLAVAGVAFVIILVALFAKRKSLSQNTKLIFTVLLIILAVYFVFIIWITIAAGGNQPANSPTPVNPSIEELTENEVVEFHGQLFNKSDLSEKTLEWLEWYNSLSPEEQLAVSSIPADLYTNDGAGSTIADAPPMVCVNDTLYKQSTKQTSYNELKDDFVYLDVIESDITNLQNNSNGNASDGIPKENFQANHPIVGAKVYQYGNDIVVEIEGKYWLYEPIEENAENEVVEFHGQLFNKSDLSEETLEWLEWYNSLSPEEQLAVSSIPADLYTDDSAGTLDSDAEELLQYCQEYVLGQAGIVGNVDVQEYVDIHEDFAIGANKYGFAVFKEPEKALNTLKELYPNAIALIQSEFGLADLTTDTCQQYKLYGAQIVTGTPEEQEQARFISKFLDIYENSYFEQ